MSLTEDQHQEAGQSTACLYSLGPQCSLLLQPEKKRKSNAFQSKHRVEIDGYKLNDICEGDQRRGL